ncbi:MAG: type III-B CRISPR module-associated protein Cmr5 [Candidatus Riflebacteria bacterium]|nr:type III-B CRISPR module-associated protein Cmr5 [Candidatus Riflebacteria bacterium]
MATLEQQRAAHAWEKVQGKSKEFKNLAKGAPALVMNNGLMPSLAFWQDKGGNSGELVRVILDWLSQRKLVASSDFSSAMVSLQKADPVKFRAVTSETLEYLKWLRNLAGAVIK